MKPKIKSFLMPLSLLLLSLQLSGCAGSRAFSRGQELYAQRDYDKSVLNYMEAVDKNPDSQEYRLRLTQALSKAAWSHLESGRLRMKERRSAEAATEFRRALEYDKTLAVAATELAKAEEWLKVDKLVQQADEFMRNRRLTQAKNSLDQVLLIDPENTGALALLEKVKNAPKTIIDGVELDVTSTKPISLKFKNTDIKDAFNILTKLSGVNFILDESLKKQSFTFDISEVSFPQALELILNMNKLGKKILNSRTIVIYSRSKDGDKQFTDHLIQTFYLSNIDAKKAVNLLRTMLQLRKVYVHEELNAIIIRDTPDVIKLAGQLLEAADRADAEVMFDLEMIEVNDSNALKLGPLLSPASISLGLGKSGEIVSGTTTTLSDAVIVGSSLTSGNSAKNLVSGGINGLSALKSYYSLPALTFDFLKTRTDSEILANPKIRVKNKEKAKVHIGSKEPVITVTSNGDVKTDSVAYVDVGIKLNIEPTIQLDDSVVTKVDLEVSTVSGRQTTNNGTQVITLTSTNANTVLTLKDGERTIIGGLIRDDKSKSRSGIVLLSDLPIIGELFTNHNNSKTKRELLLSITPHIVQNIVVPANGVGTLWSGGEDDLKSGPVFAAFTTYEEEATQPEAISQPVENKGILPLPPSASVPVEVPSLPAALETKSPVVIPPVEQPAVVQPPTEQPADVQTEVMPAAIVPPAASESEAIKTTTPPELVQLPVFEIPPAGDGSLLLLGPGQVSVGDVIKVAISGQGMNGLFSAPLFVTFDQNLFELVTVAEGDFLNRDGKATVFSTNPVPGKGELMVGYKQGVGGSGVTGDGTLFTATFRVKAPGTALFSVDRLNLRNAAGQRLKVVATPLAVEVK